MKTNATYDLGVQEPVGVTAPKRGERGWRAGKGYNSENKSGFRATGHRLLLVGEQV